MSYWIESGYAERYRLKQCTRDSVYFAIEKKMKILFVFLMLAASWAYADDPTSDDYHAMAVALAKCSGYWKAMILPMKRKNNSASVEKLQDTVYSWELASRMMFSAAYDPEGTKSYEAWKEMAGEYVEAGRMHMAFLLEEANSKEDKVMAECADIREVHVALIEIYRKGTQVDKVMKDQVEGSSPSRPTNFINFL